MSGAANREKAIAVKSVGLEVLTLIIEQQYFEEIVSGVKTEEYRSLKQTTLNKYTYIDEADGKRYSEKKSQYLADGAEYCDFTFLLYKSFLFDTFFYRLQYVVEDLIGVAEGDEVALKLRWTYVDATIQHVAEIAGETFLVAFLRILEVAHRLVVKEHREHRAHVVHLDALAFYYLLKTGEEAVAALF